MGLAATARTIGRRSLLLAALTLLPDAALGDLPRHGTPGRTYRFVNLGVEQGLPNNWVMSILKDSRGFMWLGTSDGLCRYDGFDCRVYRSSAGSAPDVPTGNVGTLYEDRQHRLWAGRFWANPGLLLYDREQDTFRAFTADGGAASLAGGDVRAITEDRRGGLWVGTQDGLSLLLDAEAGRFRTWTFAAEDRQGLPVMVVNALLEDRQQRFWVGTTRGLFLFDREQGRFQRWQEQANDPLALGRAEVWDLHEDAEGHLWVATVNSGLQRIEAGTGAVLRLMPSAADPSGLSSARLRCLAGGEDGQLWVGTENGGLNLLDTRTRRVTRLMPDREDEDSLPSPSIWSLYRDDRGALWVGTFHGGVSILSPTARRFGVIRPRRGGLSGGAVSALLEDSRGALWIGTDGGGLNELDRNSGLWRTLRHDPRDAATIGSDAVLSLLEDDDGFLWVGCWDGGLARCDRRTGRCRRFRHDPRDPGSLVGDNVWHVLALRSGELLVVTGAGVDLLDRKSLRFSRLSQRVPGAGIGEFFRAAADAAGNVWLAGSTHVERVDTSRRQVATFGPSGSAEVRLPAGTYTVAMVDSRGLVWFAADGGLVGYDPASRRMRVYTSRDGLPSTWVVSLVEDLQGDLWIGTPRGISRLEAAATLPERPRFTNFDVYDGLQGQQFSHASALRTRAGEILFGGVRGLNHFRPEEVRKNQVKPPVVLTGLRLFNQPVSPGSPGSPLRVALPEAREIVLSPRDSVVTFEFAALDYAAPRKNRFAYRLEGFDPGWNQVGTQRTATYTNLPPGRYTLRVRGSNNDGVWNDDGASLAVVVSPPFWRTWWFESGAAVLLLGALLASYRLRERSIRARAHELARKVEERTRDLARLNAELTVRTGELHSLNEELERRVAARTAELEAEKERLAVTLRSIGDGVIATDTAGRVAMMNTVAEALTGWPADEAAGRALAEVLPLRDRQTLEPRPDPVAAVIEAGELTSPQGDSRLLRRDGSESLIAHSAAPIRDRQSRIVGVVLVCRDVTAQRRVEQQLQSTQKLESLGILAGGIAHDFNNLLAGIFGLIELARSRAAEPKTREPLERAVAVLERARGLTGQLLTFSVAGQPAVERLELEPLLRRCIDFALSGSNVSCQLDLAQGLWACQADPRQIDQVVDNLLLNARQAMLEGGRIELIASNLVVPGERPLPVKPGRYVCVMVRDHGSGIPEELRSRIFEPFFTTKRTGTGLGLATSYSIVQKHGGHIEVDATPGGGATVSFFLPAAGETAGAAPESVPAPGRGVGRVLVMDDEEYVRDVLCAMLVELGYEAEGVPDGDAAVDAVALARAAGRPFDAVVLDLTIPGGIGGKVALARLRESAPGLPAIASSGYSVDPVMAHPAAHGFAAALAKPFVLEDVRRAVARALRRGGHPA